MLPERKISAIQIIKNGPLAGWSLQPLNMGNSSTPQKGIPPCSGPAVFVQVSVESRVVSRSSLKQLWTWPYCHEHTWEGLGMFLVSWARCPGIAQYFLPSLWFLIEYDLLAVFQGVSSVRSAVPFPILPFRAWVESTIGPERDCTAATLDNIRKSPLYYACQLLFY